MRLILFSSHILFFYFLLKTNKKCTSKLFLFFFIQFVGTCSFLRSL
nr:MAG TPA: hypothetical protein [Caudoviricetes sp.]